MVVLFVAAPKDSSFGLDVAESEEGLVPQGALLGTLALVQAFQAAPLGT